MNTDNRQAFLQMITYSELGPQLIADSDEGYNVIVGSVPGHMILFHDYSDHPRQLITIRPGLKSTAAGAFQILSKYFDVYRVQLGLKDFGKESQDEIALQLIRECRAMDDIDEGDLRSAIQKCSSRWASLPGAGYGQHEHSYDYLEKAFVNYGGQLA